MDDTANQNGVTAEDSAKTPTAGADIGMPATDTPTDDQVDALTTRNGLLTEIREKAEALFEHLGEEIGDDVRYLRTKFEDFFQESSNKVQEQAQPEA